MGFDTLIVNGTVVTATDTYLADVAITGGKITAIGQNLPRENTTRVLDAKNKYIMPGGIDVHTHLDMPFGGTTSADDFETGTRAAAFGGTTTLIDFAIQYKGQPLRAAFDAWMQKAAGKATTDYAFHCIITDLPNARLDEMTELVHEGVPSFKLFMAYPGVFMLDDATIFKAMQQASKIGGMICMHAENGGAIDVIVQQALAGMPITVFGDGLQTRSFCDVRDVVSMLSALAATPAAYGQVVNVGDANEITIRNLAERVRMRSGSASAIKYVPYAKAYGQSFEQIPQRRPRLNRLHSLIDVRPRWNLKATIDDLIAHYRGLASETPRAEAVAGAAA